MIEKILVFHCFITKIYKTIKRKQNDTHEIKIYLIDLNPID